MKMIGMLRQFWQALLTAGEAMRDSNCFSIAKGVAYSALLSFFPLLTTLAAVLVQARADEVSHTIASFLFEVVPPGTEEVVRALFVVHGQRPNTLLTVAVLLAAWAASGTVLSLMEGFREIYHIPSGRGWIKDRGVAILLVIATIGPMWGASALIVFGGRAEGVLTSWMGLLPAGADLTGGVRVLGELLRYGVAFGSFVLASALIYYFGPNRKQSFRLVFPGAVLATVLWVAATLAFGGYVRYVANYNLLYGSVGAGLALLVWMYVLSVIALFGCEFNAARERQRPAIVRH
jgi:membrane protein